MVEAEGFGLRDRLIEAGARLIGDGNEPSLRAVARAAGVSAMAPYRHFADKEALLGAIAARGMELFHAALVEADALSDPREALIAQGIAYVRFAQTQPVMFRLMFADGKPLPGSEPGTFGVLERRVATLVPPERRDGAVLACCGLVHGLAALAREGRLPSDEAALTAIVQRAAEALMDGIAPASGVRRIEPVSPGLR